MLLESYKGHRKEIEKRLILHPDITYIPPISAVVCMFAFIFRSLCCCLAGK